MTLNSYKFEFSKFRRYSLDGADVCSNLRYRPTIALSSCFDKKNKYDNKYNNVKLFSVKLNSLSTKYL